MGYLAPGEFFENMPQWKRFGIILKEFWIENGYFHISATETIGRGSGACSPSKFRNDGCNLVRI